MWLRTVSRPLGFVSVDVDYYSSSIEILNHLSGSANILPISSFYFDDLKRYLTPDCVGEQAAIDEFNLSSSCKLMQDGWLVEERAFPNAGWLSRMYSLYAFQHPRMSEKIERNAMRLDLIPSR
jgi:hypothetical protein